MLRRWRLGVYRKIKAFRFRIADSDCTIPDSHCRESHSQSHCVAVRSKLKSQCILAVALGLGLTLTTRRAHVSLVSL